MFLVLMGHINLNTTLVHEQTQIEPFLLYYEIFSDLWAQIRMYSSPYWIYLIELSSLAHISLYRRFASWCLRIKHNCRHTVYVPCCVIFSEYGVPECWFVLNHTAKPKINFYFQHHCPSWILNFPWYNTTLCSQLNY